MASVAYAQVPHRRVLVVEDDRDVCTLFGDALQDAGMDPVCLSSDTAAYEALAEASTYDALVVDVNLGEGTTGFDVARFARRMNPAIAVVYVSGSTPPRSFITFGVPDSAWLAKPFRPHELVTALNARLA